MRAVSGALAGVMLLALGGAALAQDDGYGYRSQPDGDSGLPSFAGLRGSLAFSSDVHVNVPTATPTSLNASRENGGGGSIYFGKRLPLGFRVELEGLYRTQQLDNLSLGGTAAPATGYTSIAAPMVNLFWDFPVPDFPLRPFVGAGIGGAYTATSLHDVGRNDSYLQNEDWHLAYQFMGGVEIPLSQSSRFTAMYRWMRVNDIGFKCGTAGAAAYACNSQLTSQSADLGLEMDM